MVKEKKETNVLEDTLKSVSEVGENGGAVTEMNASSIEPIPEEECVPTGITTLNLNLSGNARGGFRLGNCIQLFSQEGVGKSYFCYLVMKTCIDNPRFSDYKYVFMDKEGGFTIQNDPKYSAKIQIVNALNGGNCLQTIETAYMYILNLLNSGGKYIIALDSSSAFIDQTTRDNVSENMSKFVKVMDTDKEVEFDAAQLGGFAKASAKYLPLIKEKLDQTKSLLIITSQYRDKLNAGKFEEKVYTTGGNMLRYIVSYRIQLSIHDKIKVVAPSGKEYISGHILTLTTKKNRGNGLCLSCDVPFKQGGGVSDYGSLFMYLKEMNQIKSAGAYVQVPWLVEGNVFAKDLKKKVLANPDLFEKMKQKAQEVWYADQKFLMENF